MYQEGQNISQLEIKKLQQTINKQIQESPLRKKMQASEIYAQMNQKPRKSNAIMQTSSISPQSTSSKKNIQQKGKNVSKKDKSQQIQIVEKSPRPAKSEQQKKTQQRQFLIVQNKNLKQQTLNLIQQLQNLLSVTKQKKYGININDQDEGEQMKVKKATLAKQLAKITQLQTTIAYQKRQLKNVYDDQNVISQQAQVKVLQSEYQKLQKDKKAIANILKQQGKGIQLTLMSSQFQQKFTRTIQQLQKIKNECKILQSKTLQNERLLKKKHQKSVGHYTKMKKIEKILKDKEQKKKKGSIDKCVTIEMMIEVQNQITQLQTQKLQSEKSWLTKISNIESELQARKLQQQKKLLILKDKQKQVRLNDLRIKQLKKLVLSQIQAKRKVSLSQNESKKQPLIPQGRKRNIIFMDNNNKNKQSNLQ